MPRLARCWAGCWAGCRAGCRARSWPTGWLPQRRRRGQCRGASTRRASVASTPNTSRNSSNRSTAGIWGCFADVFPPGDVRRGRHRSAGPGPVRGVPRRAPRGAHWLPGRADRGAAAAAAGAVADHAAGPGEARGPPGRPGPAKLSRRATSSLGLDGIVHGSRRGPLPLRRVYLHMRRELAQHCGHADILPEQLINA